jgi:predicted Fe-Mo cluster-binding NifX family protein
MVFYRFTPGLEGKNRGFLMIKTGVIFNFCIIFIFGGLLTLKGQEEKPTKIAIASEGESLDSQVGSQGARCPWLLFFDEKGELTESLGNPYRDERGGAGIRCAKLLADNDVTIFVAGFVGNKMAGALEQHNITFISFSGTVEEAIAHVLKDKPKNPDEILR